MEPVHTKFQGRYIHLVERESWEYVTRSPSNRVVCVLTITTDDEIVFVQQYRVPVASDVIELPAGIVGDGDDLHEDVCIAAERELDEECGYRAPSFALLTAGPPSSGLANEMCSIVIAKDAYRVHEGGGVDGENITTHVIPRAQVHQQLQDWAAQGLMIDPKVYAGLYFLEHQQ